MLATSCGKLKAIQELFTTDNLTASDLSYADKIIILNKDGRADRQGTPQELGFQGSEKTVNMSEMSSDESQCSSIPPETKESVSNEADNSKQTARQTGDFSVYGYYFASMKLKVALAFIMFQLLFAFLASFPCMYHYR